MSLISPRGTGSLTAMVTGLGHRVVGVDLADNMADPARAKTVEFGQQ
jgi:predicted TPR repeat methyltransferase